MFAGAGSYSKGSGASGGGAGLTEPLRVKGRKQGVGEAGWSYTQNCWRVQQGQEGQQ